MNLNHLLYKVTSLICTLMQMLINWLKVQLTARLACPYLIWASSSYRTRFFQKRSGKCLNNFVSEEKNSVHVLHQSENFLVLHKPYDMFINSNNPDGQDTLQSEVRKILPGLVNPKLCHDFHFVHRLDYPTSGVICIALNKQAARAASAAFETRTAKKFYLALVHGHIDQPYIIIDKAIGSDTREKAGNHKMCTDDNIFCEKPRNSYTLLIVLERGFRNGKPATKVLLCPGTGRRHQLRVHCSHIGHTVIGDYTYSEGKDVEPYRTFLHSFRLILNNDIENLDVRSTDPFDGSDPRNQWKPTNISRVLDENIFSDSYKLMQ